MATDTPTLSDTTRRVYEALKAGQLEGAVGDGFETVYLPTVDRLGLSDAQWAGHLSALQGADLYHPEPEPMYCGEFGYVRMN